jgi:diacylglycerol kinase
VSQGTSRNRKSWWNPVRKLRVSLAGLWHAITSDASVARKVALSVIMLSACFYFRQWLDFLLLFAVTGMMVSAEIFNTSIEAVCDLVESGENEQVRIAKDTAAAACGICDLVWTVTFLAELGREALEFYGKW